MEAYNQCVLVAAAGNEGLCNNLACPTCNLTGVTYPAALPYVIGVMSASTDGERISSFSNYDHYPYNKTVLTISVKVDMIYSNNRRGTHESILCTRCRL